MTGTILITGATAGIGAAAARRFVRQGWKVIATGRRRGRLDALVGELGADKVHPLVLDMRDREAVGSVPERLPEPFRAVDALLNNAGMAPPMDNAQDGDLDDWRQAIDTNITGLVAITRALLPGLIDRKGMILNLCSVAATYPYRGGAV